MKLLAATGNGHKLEEFRRILEPLGIDVLSPAQLEVDASAEETGKTFAENARIKAETLYRRAGIPVVADDSGLCVDALEGRPGVQSARYMGEGTPHSQKIAALLAELKDVPDSRRTARFEAAICCKIDDNTLLECRGICRGRIGRTPSGAGGFGYDPIFVVEGGSFADLPPEQKDAMSHRGQALRQLAQQLTNYLDARGESHVAL